MLASWKAEDVLSFERPGDIAITPDGKTVLFSLRQLDSDEGVYREKLWKIDANGQSDKVQLTRSESSDSSPVVSPDGQWLGFLSNRQASADEDEADEVEHRLYILPLAGGEAMLASDSLREIYDFAFAPDGRGVYVITDVAETPYEEYLRKSAEEEERDVRHEETSPIARRICHIALPSMEVTTIYEPDYGLLQLTVSDDGQHLVFVTNYTGLTNDEEQCDLWVLDLMKKGEHRAHALVQREGACLMPAISPDSARVAYVAPRGTRQELSQSDAWVVDIRTGETRNISVEADVRGDIENVLWASNEVLLAATEERLFEPVIRFDVKDGKSAWSYVTSSDSVIRTFDVAKTTGRIAYLASSVDEPDNVFVMALDGDKPIQCTDLHADKKHLPRGRVQRFSWKNAVLDDVQGNANESHELELEGVLVLPNAKLAGQGPYPLLLDIHGGPAGHAALSFDHSYLNSHYFASLGYAVFAPNYRGSTGYGDAFVSANFKDLGGGDYRDILSGVDALIQAGLVDPSRMGVMGGSYGGYMTNWIIGHDTRFKAAVSEFGIWNLFTDFGCSSQRAWELNYIGSYWNEESLYLDRSPARYVQNIETPVMIIHGEADDNTFISNSKEMYNALVEADKTVEFVHYPREGHGVREPRHQEDELHRIATWFAHYIPTTCTVVDVPCGKGAKTLSGQLTVTVQSVRYTEAYQAHGEAFERVVEVDLSLYPNDGASGEDASHVELQANHPATSKIWLGFSGVETHRRASVFPTQKQVPKAISLGNGMLAHGDFTLSIHQPSSVKFLFEMPSWCTPDLSTWHLYIDGVRFDLTKY